MNISTDIIDSLESYFLFLPQNRPQIQLYSISVTRTDIPSNALRSIPPISASRQYEADVTAKAPRRILRRQ